MIKGITRTNNLFDASAVVSNYYIDDATGETKPSTGSVSSDYIEINPQTTYYITPMSSGNWGAWYDENKTFISGFNGYSSRTSPAGAKYVRLTVNYIGRNQDYATTFMLNAGNQPLPYEPYQTAHDITRIAMKGKNLWGVQIVQGSVTNSGDILDSDTRVRGEYIPVQPETQYTISCNKAIRMIYAYKNKSKVGLVYDGPTQNTTITFATPANCDSVCVGFMNNPNTAIITPSDIEFVMLNLGSTALPYEPYGMQQGWEVRDQQGTILWGADKTLTGTDAISFKGYGLPLKSYEIEANMEQAATQEYSIEGTSSIDYQSDGTAIALQIVGNETQTGTPTPTVPIQPQECGERTAQMIPYPYELPTTETSGVTFSVDSDGRITATGRTTANLTAIIRRNIGMLTAGTYTFSVTGKHNGLILYVRDMVAQETIANILSGNTSTSTTVTIADNTSNEIRVYMTRGVGYDVDFDCTVQLEKGGTPTAHKPNLYAIPFSNGNTTYNVYLSEPLRKIGDYGDTVSSDGTVVRRIIKVEFTGNENWIFAGDPARTIYLLLTGTYRAMDNSPAICTHYVEAESGDRIMITGDGRILRVYDSSRLYEDIDAWTTFLASEYSAGHPVEVWYVLANETTEQATFPTITPTQGANTLSVNTTLAPSKTRLTATSGVWPQNPIEPEEFGEPTVNLFDYQTMAVSMTGYYLGETGQEIATSGWKISDYIPCNGKEFTINKIGGYNPAICLYDENKQFIIGKAYRTSNAADKRPVTINSATNAKYIRFSYTTVTGSSFDDLSEIMVTEGSQPLPYEPYGKYKIPITNSGQTYNIFLNEPLRKIGTYADKVRSDGVVERKVKKIVLTGQETWYVWDLQSETLQRFYITLSISNASKYADVGVCSHFRVIHSNNDESMRFSVAGSYIYTQAVFVIERARLSTVDAAGFKAFLASEYSAGHPVEVWYVLATAQTESITAPEIATIDGSNTLAIGTTLTPSKTTITGHIKPITT